METTGVTMAPVSELITDSDRQNQTATAKTEMSKDMFLQLLVAQIRNQDPLNPADGVEFLSQLAQFSSLEQMIGIRDEVAGLRASMVAGQATDNAGAATPPEGEAQNP